MARDSDHQRASDKNLMELSEVIILCIVAIILIYLQYKLVCLANRVFLFTFKLFVAVLRTLLTGNGPLFMLVAALCISAFLLSGPPSFKFESYSLEPALPYEGALALNSALNNGERLFEGEIKGPESLAVYNNILYMGLATGEIAALADGKWTVVADLLQPCRGAWDLDNCGRPLGLSFDKKGNLWVADAYYGIYKVNVKSGIHSLIIPSSKLIATNETLEEFPRLPNAVTVASDGTLYWSDSSTQVPLHDLVIGVLGDKSGRLIKTNPNTGESQVLISNLRFANGVFLAPDESYVAVAETFEYRIHRYWLKGPKKGLSDVLVDRLPGAPDNLSPTENGGFIVNLVQQRDFLSEVLPRLPILRHFIAACLCQAQLLFQKIDEYFPCEFNKMMVAKIGHYSSIAPLLSKHSVVVFCDKDGKILRSLHSTDGVVPCVSDAVMLDGYIYMASPHNEFLGRVKV